MRFICLFFVIALASAKLKRAKLPVDENLVYTLQEGSSALQLSPMTDSSKCLMKKEATELPSYVKLFFLDENGNKLYVHEETDGSLYTSTEYTDNARFFQEKSNDVYLLKSFNGRSYIFRKYTPQPKENEPTQTLGNLGEPIQDDALAGIPKPEPVTLQLHNVYRYYNGEHFYTSNPDEIGTTAEGATGFGGYKCEGVAFKSSDTQLENMVALYRYYKPGDHFYTTNEKEIGTTTAGQVGNYGYTYEGVAAYCYQNQEEGTVPLYRYYSGEHFYTTNWNELRNGNGYYNYEGIQCYVFPA